MSNRRPLTQAEKERIYLGKLAERTLSELAVEIDCSVECVRKWWRVGRDTGLEGLRASRRPRGQSGMLSQFDPRVVEKALWLKRGHPRWGADRVLVELKNDPVLRKLQLPRRSRLASFFKECCPECVTARKVRPEPPKRAPDVTGVHEMWQLDNQEGIYLNNGQIATICNIRDPVGAAMLASRAFSVKTEKHWRKLTWTEVRGVLRDAFTEWRTLPDGLQTDNELALVGGPNDPFPGRLTLWLIGLGIIHRFIRPGCPTDQPQIERNHRTLDNFALDEQALTDLEHLQQALDRERSMYNHHFPCRASSCAGQPPLVAYPQLLKPRRYYQPELELVLFDIQRVYDYLANFTFERAVNASAQISLGRQMYCLGRKLVREHQIERVLVYFDSDQNVWVFLAENDQELIRRPPKDLDVQSLTGLDPSAVQPIQPVQLTLPFLVA